jgi:hypothetical protein
VSVGGSRHFSSSALVTFFLLLALPCLVLSCLNTPPFFPFFASSGFLSNYHTRPCFFFVTTHEGYLAFTFFLPSLLARMSFGEDVFSTTWHSNIPPVFLHWSGVWIRDGYLILGSQSKSRSNDGFGAWTWTKGLGLGINVWRSCERSPGCGRWGSFV